MAGVIFTGFLATAIGGAIYFAVSGGRDPSVNAPIPFGALIVSLLTLWAGFAIIPVALIRQGRRSEVLDDLRPSVHWRDAAWIIPGGLLQLPASLPYRLWDAVTGSDVSERLGDSAEELFESSSGIGMTFWVLAILVVIGAPVVEELVFRCGLQGAVLAALRARGSTVSAVASVVISAVVFGAFHLQPLQFFALALFGCAAGALHHYSRRLGPPMMLHVGFNLVTVIALGFQLADR
jgi:membrane protease YdiL (CAAX protease family)